MVITTAQLHSTKPELRFCAGSNPAHGVSEIRDGEDLWQWSRLEIRLNAFRRSTTPQKQFIIHHVFWKVVALKRKPSRKSRFFENVALLKKLMVCRSTCFNQRRSSLDIFILSNYSTKKIAIPKSNCPKELLILTKWLFGRNLFPKLGSCCNGMTLENGAP